MPHPASIEPLRRWDPEQIGGYALIGRLGAGAMGQVYLGRSAAGRMVAVKTIKIEFAEEPGFRTRFGQEVAAARRVSGAFTAPVVAADPEADIPWLATAYVPAPSLSTLVRTCGPMSVPAVRWLAAGCAEALESIHGAGLVHRDLKPSNVLVSPDGPRVIDFGVARAAERIALTVTRGAIGTPAYMAPEQARDNRQATMASDVYSLGGTILCAATGHGPYHGDTVMDVLVQLATEPPDLSDLPADLADIVTACLQRDPRKRPVPASVLAHLAPGIGPAPGTREPGTAVLSGAALTLIAEYRRDPRPSGQSSADAGDDDTFGSQPVLGGSPKSATGHKDLSQSKASHRRSASSAPAGGIRSGKPRGPSSPIIFAYLLAAIVLMAAGVGVGAYIAGRPAAATAGGPSASTGTGNGQHRPPLGHPPPIRGLDSHNGKPRIAVLQPFGDTYTEFVVQGAGWAPGRSLTVTLVGVGASPVHPLADRAGNFSYAINQGHEFFRGGLPPGAYQVLVTGPGGGRATDTFVVNGN